MQPVSEEPRRERLIKIKEDFYIVNLSSLFRKKDDKKFEYVRFATPNVMALYLSISDKAFKRAKNVFKNELLPTIKYNNEDKCYYITISETKIYDMLEDIILVITFAYLAVEVAANSFIPANFKCIYKGKEKNKEELERLSTSEKLIEILPKVHNIFDVNKIKSWSNFKNLEVIRNEIVHKKGEILSEKKYSKTNMFISDIFESVILKDQHASARDVITYCVSFLGDYPGIPQEFLPTISEGEKHFKNIGYSDYNENDFS